ncbi:MAG TPA: Crp/Fnr family transcriptional regulator [Pseudolabrys sp.]|jgi:CRP-like cAMP-binding protein|nr:Crp/Fnr family transcriptional regulator [Pseudolabrys sp.]
MPLEDDIAFLESVPTLALLGRPALRILAIGTETKKVPSGAVLFYAGDLADCGYVVQDGTFMLEDDRPGKHEETNVGPGTLLGDLALITDTVRTETATAQEPSIVIRIPRSLFLKMLEGYPEAARSLRDAMAERLEAWTRDLSAVKEKLETGMKDG